MIALLVGEVENIGFESVTLLVGGVGYSVQMSVKDVSALVKGDKVKVFITEVIREQSFDLYGFTNERDKRFFDLMLKVSGVGPRIALALMSIASADEIMSAIQSANLTILTSAPGVGKKLAERIVVEMRDKVKLFGISGTIVGNSGTRQAEEALAALGFKDSDVAAMLKNVDVTLSVEEQVRFALRGGKK
jgi:Holliday junction DNA helicase RuvA